MAPKSNGPDPQSTQSGAHLSVVWDATSDALCLIDRAGTIVTANRAYLELFGVALVEAVGIPFSRFLPPERRAYLLAHHRDRMLRGDASPPLMEITVRRADGAERQVQLAIDDVMVDGRVTATVVSIRDVTERALADAAMRDSEERLRLALAAAGMGVYAWDPAADSSDVDDQLRAVVGLEPGEDFSLAAALGRHLHLDDRAGFATAVCDMLEPDGDGHMAEEVRWLGSDGRERWLAFVGQAYFGTRIGCPVHVVATVRDVTEEKQTEAELRSSEARYRTLVEQIPVVAYTRGVGPVSPLLYIAPRVEEMLGYPASEWLEDPGLWSRILHPADRDAAKSKRRRSVATGEPFVLEYRLRSVDGRWVWVHDETRLMHDEKGLPTFRQGLMQDITPAKRIEAEAKQTETERSLMAAIVAGTEDGVLSCSLDGTITSWNHGAERIYGWLAAEAIGQPVDILRPADHRDDLAGMIGRVRRGESVAGHETVRMTRDGRRINVALTMSPLRDVTGGIVGVASISHDIPTAKRTEVELIMARDAADEANRHKSAFLSTMTHELRTPMTAIIGYTELLLKDRSRSLDAEQRRDLRQIATSADRLLGLINDVLDLSRNQEN